MVAPVEHTLGGTIELVGSPLRFSHSAQTSPTSPPTLGQHTDEILERQLGWSDTRIRDWRCRGAFGPLLESGRAEA